MTWPFKGLNKSTKVHNQSIRISLVNSSGGADADLVLGRADHGVHHPLLPVADGERRGGAAEAHRPDVRRVGDRRGRGRQREEDARVADTGKTFHNNSKADPKKKTIAANNDHPESDG